MSSVTDTKRGKIRKVHAELRDRIVVGRHRPGERLPTFDEMEREFAVSRTVLQQAVGRLRQDGFVRTVQRRGLFVVDSPPHRCRVALLFDDAPGDPNWSRMNTALVNESKRLEREHADWQFQICDGVLNLRTGPDRLAEVEADVLAHRLAGVIFTPKTADLSVRPHLSTPSLAKAFICAADEWKTPSIVSVDSVSLYRRALERLVSKGRRRIAILHMAETTYTLNHAALFAELDLPLHRPWVQWVVRSHPEYAESLVALLLDYPADQRPNGLIIADDNLIEHAAAGIVAAGLHVGRDLDVVAHCNWPWPLPSVLPLERIGFDATDILRRSIEAIEAQLQGRRPVRLQKVPALFEWEVASSTAQPRSPKAARQTGTR